MKQTIELGFCALALTVAPLIQAEELGRLFHTPAERAQLESEHARSTNPADNPNTLSVDGIVQRHGGERTIWINGVGQRAGKSDERTPDSVPVAVPGQSHPVKVKVGQKVIVHPSPPQE